MRAGGGREGGREGDRGREGGERGEGGEGGEGGEKEGAKEGVFPCLCTWKYMCIAH